MSEIKDIFFGYRKKSKDEASKIIENGLIAFDTNVLLNLYRYSKETREQFLGVIEKLSDRIFLPYQVAYEYSKNRYVKIMEQEALYDEFQKNLSKFKSDIESTIKPPFLSKELEKTLNTILDKVETENSDSKKKHTELLRNDTVYDEVNRLFKDKITDKLSIEEEEKLLKEGDERYNKEIPPGYKDAKPKKDITMFGDLILWKQVIEHAKKRKKDILLITDDNKEDWWWKLNGKTMGPRPELIEEIKKEANVNFHMYSSERFLEYAQEYLKESVNSKALKEIQAIKRAEAEENAWIRKQEKIELRKRSMYIVIELTK